MQIEIKLLDKKMPIPSYAYIGDAGADLRSAVDVVIPCLSRALIPTGIAISIPDGYAGFVQPRSGLAINHGISLINSPGLIDSKYRGEIKVIMLNSDTENPFSIKRFDKIAQLVIQKIESVDFIIVNNLDITERGEGGFGSSGK